MSCNETHLYTWNVLLHSVDTMAKRQICFSIDEETAREMEKLRDETGLPLSKVIELRLKGYEIRKRKQ